MAQTAFFPTVRERFEELVHLFYPHCCGGCGSDLVQRDAPICMRCFTELPETGFAALPDNPVEKIFHGRLPVKAAHSAYYFSKDSVMQTLIHRLKYRGDRKLGEYLGLQLGASLRQGNRFNDIDVLLPMPMYRSKEKLRGYNQAEVIAKGVAEATGIPVEPRLLLRQRLTQTQTRKHRTERWQNVEGSFVTPHPDQLSGKHLLLVDDVITTGASIEAAGRILAAIDGVRISVASVSVASRS